MSILTRGAEFNSREAWADQSEEATMNVAAVFGYAYNAKFQAAADDFRRTTVSTSSVGSFLSLYAGKHFEKWQPPLELSAPNGQVSLTPQETFPNSPASA